MVTNDLYQSLKFASEKIDNISENEKNIIIISKKNTDCIIASSIFAYALLRKGSKFSIRVVDDINSDVISKISSENHDFQLFLDHDNNYISKINKSFKDRCIIINNSENIEKTKEITSIINPYLYGIIDKNEISLSGLAFLISEYLDKKNKTLCGLSMVGAMSERQDVGEKKSFVGINSNILSKALSLGILEKKIDFVFANFNKSPLYEALIFNTTPYIHGITWNKQNCLKVLKNSGINTHRNGIWKTFDEISQQDKNAILDSIIKFVFLSSNYNNNENIELISNNLISNIYSFIEEDDSTILYTVRGFYEVISASLNQGKSGLAIEICVGNKNAIINKIEKMIIEYKTRIMEIISTIFNERWRITDKHDLVIINGEGLIKEEQLEEISLSLSEDVFLNRKLIMVRTLTKDNRNYKFYYGRGSNCDNNLKFENVINKYVNKLTQSRFGYLLFNITYTKIEEFISEIRIESKK
ncbi:MAG: hypothetical protein ACPKQO_02435 [Nitrososphaeraceae archaeon]